MDKTYIISQMKALSRKLCLDLDDEVYDSVIEFSEFKVYSKGSLLAGIGDKADKAGIVLNALWFGTMISLTAHFLVHIWQSIYIRKYIPSLITSLICLPLSVIIIIKSLSIISIDLLTIILIPVTIIGMILNLRFAHGLMHKYGKKLSGKS